MIKNGEKYLITLDQYFVAPDGQQYRAVWGKAFIKKTEEVFNFKLTKSTNWFVQVGNDGEPGTIILAGCQIHFAITCPDRPEDEFFGKYLKQKDEEWKGDPVYLHASRIYYVSNNDEERT